MDRNCSEMTKIFYEDKMTYKEFVSILKDSLDPFLQNMKNLDYQKQQEHEDYIENLMETFCTWMEIQKGEK